MTQQEFDYMTQRVDDQIAYFDKAAIRNQRYYKWLKRISVTCNVLTTMTIALAFTVSERFKLAMGIVALILSTMVLATYQWEEFENFGAKWEKFRLVAEQLRSEKFYFLCKAGKYANISGDDAAVAFVEVVERIIKGTDISYFSLMVEPGKRIEKRLESVGQE